VDERTTTEESDLGPEPLLDLQAEQRRLEEEGWETYARQAENTRENGPMEEMCHIPELQEVQISREVEDEPPQTAADIQLMNGLWCSMPSQHNLQIAQLGSSSSIDFCFKRSATRAHMRLHSSKKHEPA